MTASTIIRLLGVDPGGSTGWTLVEVGEESVKPLDRGQPGDPDKYEHHQDLFIDMRICQPVDLVICERFEHRNDEFAELISLEYIGVVKAFCQRYNIPLVMQGSSEAKHWATNDKLKRLDLRFLPLGKWKHANDGMRHVVYFICCSQKIPLILQPTILQARAYLLHKLRPARLTSAATRFDMKQDVHRPL